MNTIVGGLRGLKLLARESRQTGKSIANLASEKSEHEQRKNLKQEREALRKASEVARVRKRVRRNKPQNTGCTACGGKPTNKREVRFKLDSGPEGSMLADICASHKVGGDWRGVGVILAISDPNKPSKPLTETDRKVLQTINGKVKASAIAEVLGVTQSTACKRLLKLHKLGLLTREKSGRTYCYSKAN